MTSTIDGVVPYPAEFVHRYREEGYWTGTTHDELLRSAARSGPDRVAVIDGDRVLTYAELDDVVGRAATLLTGLLNVRSGERVVVQLPNIAEFVVVTFALFRLGVVPVFALPAHRRADLTHFVTASDAVGIVTRSHIAGFDHATLAREVAASAPGKCHVVLVDDVHGRALVDAAEECEPSNSVPVHPSDLAFLQLSGGTTGTPKLIPRTHDDYLYSVRESARICGLSERSRMLVAMPISHNFTMSSPGILGIIHAGGAMVLTQDPSAPRIFALIEQHAVTIVPAVPPLVLGWLNAPELADAHLDSLEVLQVGGAKLSRAVAERIPSAFGVTLQQVFGMAEGLVNYTRLEDDLGTVTSTQGLRISPADEVRVVDAQDAEVPRGEPGNLLTRGPYTIRGYYRAPEHNAKAFTTDGFYRTGDIVVEREDGYLTVVGRSKDQINRGGEKVAPEEVENALLRHPAVHDVSVSSTPDEVLGERIQAHIVLRPDAKRPRPVDLRRFVAAEGLAVFKIPDAFTFVDALTETGVGKVARGQHPHTSPERTT